MARKSGSSRAEKRKIFAGRYAYVKPLGRGAGGAVYLAEDLRADNRLVALKVLSAEAFATVQGKMLRREFEILSKLDHPNLVRVYDYGSLPDGGVFLAEEYIDGFSLQDARALVDPEGLIDVTLQMLQGLSYLHGMGMIHRDIKPANVMLLWLDDAKARPMVKLVDFGLSSADPKRDTLRGGTRSYMAPEIIRGEKGEFRSDLYSLGVTLYYAMCGVLPFGPRTKEDPPPTEEDFRPPEPHRLNPEVPLSLSRFTMVLLRQLPEVEFMDAGEALQALAGDTESLEWVATGQLANNLDIAAPPVLRGYFERGILQRQDAQRDMLVEALSEERSTGRLTVVRGPAGVGKSRLMDEVVCATKLSQRIVVAAEPADSAEEPAPFRLLMEVLRQLVEIAESRGLRVGERFQPRIHMLDRLAPWIGYTKTAEERSGDYAWIREAFEDIVVMLHPDKVVLFVEDFHHADADTVAFFARWYDDSGAFHRPDMVVSIVPGHPTDELLVASDVDVVEAKGLRPEDVAYFFRERLGEESLPDDWIARVASASRGNPAYVEELSRHLIDSGIVRRQSSISWKIETEQLLHFSLPRGIEESLRRRLSSLGALGRETLELMALIGEPVEWSILRKLLMAGGESIEDAERTIEILLWRNFVYLELNDQGRFLRLIAPALGEVVLQRMNPEWRRSLHRRIGDRLRKQWMLGLAPAGVAAEHLRIGGREEEARTLFEVAGDAAMASSNFLEAAHHYNLAIELGAHGPAGAMCRVRLAEACIRSYEVERGCELLEQAWTSAERTALDWLMYRICVAGATSLLILGQPARASDWLDRLRDYLPVLARQPEVLTLEARLYTMRGQLTAAKERLRQAMQQCEHFGYERGLVGAENELARLELVSGDLEDARGLILDAVETAAAADYYNELGDATCTRGILARVTGELRVAEETLDEAFELVTMHGNVDRWSEVLLEIAELKLAAGELEQARKRAREALELADDLGHELWRERAKLLLGQVGVQIGGDVKASLELMREAVSGISASAFSFPYGPAALERLGHALRRAGQEEEGTTCLEQAKKLGDEFGILEGRNFG